MLNLIRWLWQDVEKFRSNNIKIFFISIFSILAFIRMGVPNAFGTGWVQKKCVRNLQKIF